MVAWCMGVLPVPGLTAVNGPFLIDCIKLVNGTVALWGLLSREMGHELTLPLSSDKPNNIRSFPPRWVYTHCVYPSCLHAVSVCCWVQPSTHTLLQPVPGLCTCRTCWADMRRTAEEAERRGDIVCFPAVCLCVCALTKQDKVRSFPLPGKVVLTLKLDTQVISSSAPIQSCIPSQAWSIGMNLTERLQKKYLLSISFLTAEERTLRLSEMIWDGKVLKVVFLRP